MATIEVAERFLMTGADDDLRFAVAGFYRILLDQSAALADRAQLANTKGDRRDEVGASAASVLTAAGACDTFLSEFLTRAQMFRVLDTQAAGRIRSERDAAEQWKLLIKERASDSTAAAAFNPSTSREYANIRCLLRLRNHVAHRHSRLTPADSWPQGLADCVAQKLIPVNDGRFFDWATAAYTHVVAAWAHSGASAWLELMDNTIGFTC